VVIVSLILIILLALIPFVLHLTVKLDRQIKRNEAILQRLDEKEKKREKSNVGPEPNPDSGM
jgi:inner membrane protein involved in colicin E2 resistance